VASKKKPAAKSASSKQKNLPKVSPKRASPPKGPSKTGGPKKAPTGQGLKKKTKTAAPPQQAAAPKPSKPGKPKPKAVAAKAKKVSPKPHQKAVKPPPPLLAKPTAAKATKLPSAKPAQDKPAMRKKPSPSSVELPPRQNNPTSLMPPLQAKTHAEVAMGVMGAMGVMPEAFSEELGFGEVQENINWAMFFGPLPDKPSPKLSELPSLMTALTRREMEQVLTVGSGRGVAGEGSMKGKLLLHMGFPYLEVMGRDRRELYFLLQGPDQEVFPAYAQHRVSVSGLIRKTHNYGGTIDVRKYSAKSTEVELVLAPVVVEPKLQFLSPGELQQIATPGMGAGMRGFASIRGVVELSGESYNLILGGQGTWQQVSFRLEGVLLEGLRPHIGQTLQVTGVVEKETGWSGRVLAESHELRAPTLRALSREGLDVYTIAPTEASSVVLEGRQALLVCLEEVPRYVWTVDIAVAKRLGLREVVSRPKSEQGIEVQKEFFFLPRMPGIFELDFFLSKIVSPQQFDRSFRLHVTILPG